MRIERLGHSSVAIETDEVFCLMDPVFVEPLASGTACFDPPLAFDVTRAREQCNVIVLSHHHPDHFCVRSLAQLDREAIVYYPAGSSWIELSLRRLGFDKARPVHPGIDDITIADLRMIATPSRVPFPEMGVLFCAGGQSFWNLVDTFVDEPIVALTRKVTDRIDLLFAAYQPLDQMLNQGALGHPFPYQCYGDMLRVVFDIRPRAVAPAACGVRYLGDPWLGERGFPMTARQFLADVARVDPEIEGVLLPPGGSVELGAKQVVDERGSTVVVRLGDRLEPEHDWRPDRGVGPLTDKNPLEYPPDELRVEVNAFVEGRLLQEIDLVIGPAWRARMARLEALWRLEIVFPDGSREIRHCDLAAARLRWAPPAPDAFAKIHTSIAASAILGFLRGDFHPDRLLLGDARSSFRLYAPHRGGVEVAEGISDDPLLRILNHGALERFIERELRAVGCQ